MGKCIITRRGGGESPKLTSIASLNSKNGIRDGSSGSYLTKASISGSFKALIAIIYYRSDTGNPGNANMQYGNQLGSYLSTKATNYSSDYSSDILWQKDLITLSTNSTPDTPGAVHAVVYGIE